MTIYLKNGTRIYADSVTMNENILTYQDRDNKRGTLVSHVMKIDRVKTIRAGQSVLEVYSLQGQEGVTNE